MNNTCTVCKATIDDYWSALQHRISQITDLSEPLNCAFVKRCIYCYKAIVELTAKHEHEWYKEVIRAVEEKFKC